MISIEIKMVISCVLFIATNWILEMSNGMVDIWWGVFAVVLLMFLTKSKSKDDKEKNNE